MKKETRLFAGIALLVNACTSLILFFIFLGKKKGIAGAFAAVAALTGAAGGYLLYEEKVANALKEKNCENCEEGDCENCDENSETDEDELDIGEEDLFAREEPEA